jgi:hypothetical protein
MAAVASLRRDVPLANVGRLTDAITHLSCDDPVLGAFQGPIDNSD